MMSNPCTCPFNPVFSSPSFFEVGEGSLAGEGDSAQASVTFVDKFGASARCAMSLVEADAPVLIGPSSGEPTTTRGEADDHPSVGTFSDELAVASGEADGSSSAGISSDELAGKANGPLDAGTSFDELAAPQDEVDD